MEILDNTLNEYNQKIIDHILEEFTSLDLPEALPGISDIKNFVNVIAAANPNIQDIQSNAFVMDPITRLDDPTLKSALFSLGTTLFHFTIKGDIPDDNIKSAKTLLEWAIKIDPTYYEAYNRLGDCWMRIMGGFESAVSCYKEALLHAQQKEATANQTPNAQLDNFKGDNYFKIGVCFIKLKRKGDAELFITVAKNIVGTDYQGLAEIGLKSWDQVFELLSRI